jgi:hypothetical protein
LLPKRDTKIEYTTGAVEERRRIIKEGNAKIYEELQRILPTCHTEADFRRYVDPLLQEFCGEIDVHPLPQAEYTVAAGRIDAVFNRLVIQDGCQEAVKTPDFERGATNT